MSDLAAVGGLYETEQLDHKIHVKGSRAEIAKALRASAVFLLIGAAVWLAAFWADRELVYIRPGSDLMYSAKAEAIGHDALLDMSKPIRVLVIGNSKVMAGFVPDQFERQVPGSSAYNLGQPNSTVFVDQLASLFERGQVPTHVLFAIEWSDPPEPSRNFFHFTGSDREIMNTLFPFRQFVRNGVVFLLRSRKYGGVRNFYHFGEAATTQMLRDRGYHFISDQSRFPNFQLPPDFKMAGDNPNQKVYRSANVTSHAFLELNQLATRYGVKVLVVPYYLRKGELASPGVNQAMARALAPYPAFQLAGDEYLLYDNRYFSDTAHLNPAGASIYTGTLADIVNREVATGRAAHAF